MGNVQVSEADMQDPELAAELAALAGEMGGSAPVPAPASRPATAVATAPTPSSGANADIDGQITRLTRTLAEATKQGNEDVALKVKTRLAKLQKDKAASTVSAASLFSLKSNCQTTPKSWVSTYITLMAK